MSGGLGVEMSSAGSSRSSQGHKEPFRAAGGGWGSARCCSTSLCMGSTTGALLGSVCALCWLLNRLWRMRRPLFSSPRAERDLFRTWGQLLTSAQCSGRPVLVAPGWATAPTPIASGGGTAGSSTTVKHHVLGLHHVPGLADKLKTPLGCTGGGMSNGLTLRAKEPGYLPTAFPQPPPHRRAELMHKRAFAARLSQEPGMPCQLPSACRHQVDGKGPGGVQSTPAPWGQPILPSTTPRPSHGSQGGSWLEAVRQICSGRSAG